MLARSLFSVAAASAIFNHLCHWVIPPPSQNTFRWKKSGENFPEKNKNLFENFGKKFKKCWNNSENPFKGNLTFIITSKSFFLSSKMFEKFDKTRTCVGKSTNIY
jgi:hypothetical protein